jgi:hypothetical protein
MNPLLVAIESLPRLFSMAAAIITLDHKRMIDIMITPRYASITAFHDFRLSHNQATHIPANLADVTSLN